MVSGDNETSILMPANKCVLEVLEKNLDLLCLKLTSLSKFYFPTQFSQRLVIKSFISLFNLGSFILSSIVGFIFLTILLRPLTPQHYSYLDSIKTFGLNYNSYSSLNISPFKEKRYLKTKSKSQFLLYSFFSINLLISTISC